MPKDNKVEPLDRESTGDMVSGQTTNPWIAAGLLFVAVTDKLNETIEALNTLQDQVHSLENNSKRGR